VVTAHPTIVDDVLQQILNRARDPRGPRLFDYRPDVVALRTAVLAGLDLHRPVGESALCVSCHERHPCPTRQAMEDGLIHSWRTAAQELQAGGWNSGTCSPPDACHSKSEPPADPPTGRWFDASHGAAQ